MLEKWREKMFNNNRWFLIVIALIGTFLVTNFVSLNVFNSYKGDNVEYQQKKNESDKVMVYDSVSGTIKLKEKIKKSDSEWKEQLKPTEFRVTQKKGTEAPYTGKYDKHFEEGVYRCVACGNDLFKSTTKYNSGCGWPSFWEPISKHNLKYKEDNSLLVSRTEIVCTQCGAHLGHVFEDGPRPTGLRYCVNSASLDFVSSDDLEKMRSRTEESIHTATFAAGCFWGVEAAFRNVKGVRATEVGYTGGHVEDPTYNEVCRNDTGHAEAVRVEFDPKVVSYDDLLDVFWSIHDPTTLNRQGPDVGSQYRSAIFYHSLDQKAAAEASIAKHQPEFNGKIVTELVSAEKFYKAEDYHQQYLEKRGLATCHI